MTTTNIHYQIKWSDGSNATPADITLEEARAFIMQMNDRIKSHLKLFEVTTTVTEVELPLLDDKPTTE